MAGQLRTRQFRLTGAAELTTARVEKVPINRLAFRWALDRDWARLTDVGASFAGGTLVGSAAVPSPGNDPRVGVLHAPPGGPEGGRSEHPDRAVLPAEGRVDGAFAARIPVDRAGLTASAALVSEQMRVRGSRPSG